MTKISVPTSGPHKQIDFARPLFVVGRNGAGKSALVHFFQKELSGRSVYLPGSRSVIFDGEGMNMTANTRRDYGRDSLVWDS